MKKFLNPRRVLSILAASCLAAAGYAAALAPAAAAAAAPDDAVSIGLAVQIGTPCPGVTEGSLGHDAGRVASCQDGIWRAAATDFPLPGGRKFLSVGGLRDMLPRLYERAVKEPTDENVASYVYAQRLVLDLAQRVAQKCAGGADDATARGCVERTLQEQL